MRREFAVALWASLPVSFAAGQQPVPTPAIPQPVAPTVYYAGPGVIAPVLLSSTLSISSQRHCNPYDGVVKLSAVVDDNGMPHSVDFQSGDMRLANVAIGIIDEERFQPGTRNNLPAAVAIEATVGMQTCSRLAKSADDLESYEFTLRAHPMIAIGILAKPPASLESVSPAISEGEASGIIGAPNAYKVGGHISPPTLINQVEAEYSDYGRENRITGICAIGLIVDANGVPQNVHVIKGLEPTMDDNAIDAVKQYRFKPAMKDGTTPVPVEITVEIDFKLVKKKRF
jgi:TonB family protein